LTTSSKLRGAAGVMTTWPPGERTAPAPQPSSPATKLRQVVAHIAGRELRRPAIEVGAADAAVAEALGILLVSLAVASTRSNGTPSSSATICATLVFRPWPISVPPWFTCTLPSVYTCTSAPAWLNSVAVNEMPNLTGVSAMPRLITGLAAFQRAISAWRSR
jgi:hypothetical protein